VMLDEASPDLLLHEVPTVSRYLKLGSENLSGRSTTKYRVSNGDPTTESETFIWIDESLGMPIRSETTHRSATLTTKTLMELKDIRLEVDERLFVLPSDYREVAISELLQQMSGASGKTVVPDSKK